MKIQEPTTTLTDYLMALLSLYFASSLYRQARMLEQRSVWLWATGFALAAAAALVGGTYHGFPFWFSPEGKRSLWNITVFLIGLAAGFMLAGTYVGSTAWQEAATLWLLAGVGVSLLGFGVQQSGWRWHAHFNHNDLYHCLQMVALYLFYRGAFLLQDR